MYKTMNANYQRSVNAERNKASRVRGPKGTPNRKNTARIIDEIAKMDAEIEAERAERHAKYVYTKK